MSNPFADMPISNAVIPGSPEDIRRKQEGQGQPQQQQVQQGQPAPQQAGPRYRDAGSNQPRPRAPYTPGAIDTLNPAEVDSRDTDASREYGRSVFKGAIAGTKRVMSLANIDNINEASPETSQKWMAEAKVAAARKRAAGANPNLSLFDKVGSDISANPYTYAAAPFGGSSLTAQLTAGGLVGGLMAGTEPDSTPKSTLEGAAFGIGTAGVLKGLHTAFTGNFGGEAAGVMAPRANPNPNPNAGNYLKRLPANMSQNPFMGALPGYKGGVSLPPEVATNEALEEVFNAIRNSKLREPGTAMHISDLEDIARTNGSDGDLARDFLARIRKASATHFGVDVSKGDVSASQTLRQTEQGLEKAPVSGMNKFRIKQGQQINSAIQGVEDDTRRAVYSGDHEFKPNNLPRGAGEEPVVNSRGLSNNTQNLIDEGNALKDPNRTIKGSLTGQLENNKRISSKYHNELNDAIEEAANAQGSSSDVDISHISNRGKTPGQIENLLTENNNSVAYDPIVDRELKRLQENLTSIDKNLSYGGIKKAVSQLEGQIQGMYAGETPNRTGIATLQKVVDALNGAADGKATELLGTNNPLLTKASQFHKYNVVPYQDGDQGINKIINGIDADKSVKSYFSSASSDEFDRLYSALDPKGRAAVRLGILQNAKEAATINGKFNPQAYSKYLSDRSRQVEHAFGAKQADVMFSGSGLSYHSTTTTAHDEIEALQHLIQNTPRAGKTSATHYSVSPGRIARVAASELIGGPLAVVGEQGLEQTSHILRGRALTSNDNWANYTRREPFNPEVNIKTPPPVHLYDHPGNTVDIMDFTRKRQSPGNPNPNPSFSYGNNPTRPPRPSGGGDIDWGDPSPVDPNAERAAWDINNGDLGAARYVPGRSQNIYGMPTTGPEHPGSPSFNVGKNTEYGSWDVSRDQRPQIADTKDISNHQAGTQLTNRADVEQVGNIQSARNATKQYAGDFRREYNTSVNALPVSPKMASVEKRMANTYKDSQTFNDLETGVRGYDQDRFNQGKQRYMTAPFREATTIPEILNARKQITAKITNLEEGGSLDLNNNKIGNDADRAAVISSMKNSIKDIDRMLSQKQYPPEHWMDVLNDQNKQLQAAHQQNINTGGGDAALAEKIKELKSNADAAHSILELQSEAVKRRTAGLQTSGVGKTNFRASYGNDVATNGGGGSQQGGSLLEGGTSTGNTDSSLNLTTKPHNSFGPNSLGAAEYNPKEQPNIEGRPSNEGTGNRPLPIPGTTTRIHNPFDNAAKQLDEVNRALAEKAKYGKIINKPTEAKPLDDGTYLSQSLSEVEQLREHIAAHAQAHGVEGVTNIQKRLQQLDNTLFTESQRDKSPGFIQGLINRTKTLMAKLNIIKSPEEIQTQAPGTMYTDTKGVMGRTKHPILDGDNPEMDLSRVKEISTKEELDALPLGTPWRLKGHYITETKQFDSYIPTYIKSANKKARVGGYAVEGGNLDNDLLDNFKEINDRDEIDALPINTMWRLKGTNIVGVKESKSKYIRQQNNKSIMKSPDADK